MRTMDERPPRPAPLPAERALSQRHIDRPRLRRALATATQRRVTALTAGPGFGKTTALTSFAAERDAAWYSLTEFDRDPVFLARGLVESLSPHVFGSLDALAQAITAGRGPDGIVSAFVPVLAGVLQEQLADDLVLVLDDLHEVTSRTPAADLVAELCQLSPPRLHLVVASRSDLPFPVESLRLHGHLQIMTAQSLAFDESEIAALLALVGNDRLGPFAPTIRELTGGWPAVVRLVAEAVAVAADEERTMAALLSHGGAVELVEGLLTDDVTDGGPGLEGLLAVGATVDSFNGPLLTALGVPHAPTVLAAAHRRGVHVAPAARAGWFALTPLSREFAATRLGPPAGTTEDVLRTAAQWHLDQGEPVTALRYLSRLGDGAGIVDILSKQGSMLLGGGHRVIVVEALRRVGAELRTPGIELVEGEAAHLGGDWDRAVRCLSRLVPDSGPVPAGAAWRLGLIHHMRGEAAQAIALYRRGIDDLTGTVEDRGLAAAWGSAAAWLTGDARSARSLAEAAQTLATGSTDHRLLAAVHTAIAMLAALDGDRANNDRHYGIALDHAERAGDVLQIIRIRGNRGSRLLEEGDYGEAIAELDTAIALADLAGYGTLRAIALQNRAEASRHLGRLADSARDSRAALAAHQALGSWLAAYALVGLGAVHADQGSFSLARACFEEAVELADRAGDLQGLVPALCGLARTVAAVDPETATVHIDRALQSGANLSYTQALLAAGWVALRRQDLDQVRTRATEAAALARRRRDRAGIAESLELLASVASDPYERRTLLSEAGAVWLALGCPLPLARTRIALARSGAANADALLAEVERTCRELGARALATEAAEVRAAMRPGPTPAGREVVIRTLGGFRVSLSGVPVALTAWQSRKARDLLKMLIARRGVPTPRSALCEELWPDVDPARASSRLSVAISTLRGVLDPGKVHPADRYVVSEEGVVSLSDEHIEVDVVSFLTVANDAIARGDLTDLALAEASYTGDFCEEDLYADWAAPLREDARTAYVAVARTLARFHSKAGDHDAAVRLLQRVLSHEPYEEGSHLALVVELDAVGRPGDARRMYRAYATRMAELEVEPAPYPTRE